MKTAGGRKGIAGARLSLIIRPRHLARSREQGTVLLGACRAESSTDLVENPLRLCFHSPVRHVQDSLALARNPIAPLEIFLPLPHLKVMLSTVHLNHDVATEVFEVHSGNEPGFVPDHLLTRRLRKPSPSQQLHELRLEPAVGRRSTRFPPGKNSPQHSCAPSSPASDFLHPCFQPPDGRQPSAQRRLHGCLDHICTRYCTQVDERSMSGRNGNARQHACISRGHVRNPMNHDIRPARSNRD